ncbi:hypothetical protein ASE76_07145 [Xylophilus sp. Leaf220]|nr:hypothetical protein ASE76_07145 [Xylophilus sp. Leaf220]
MQRVPAGKPRGAVGEQATPPASSDAPSFDSMSLLRGSKVVEIAHNGSVYRLQATKLGKLILTK